MKTFDSDSLKKKVSKLGVGTWAIGGWLWGGSDDLKSLKAVEESLALGVNLIDTAPVYGFGKAESVVGQILKEVPNREDVIIATKCGLEWNNKQDKIRRNSSPERILKEIDESRYRLQTDYIDIYQIHWPDTQIPFGKTLAVLEKLYTQGTIRAIGLSNFSLGQVEECLKMIPIHFLQLPYNLYERGVETEMFEFCDEKKIPILGYGGLCRGLLTGKFSVSTEIREDDIRSRDPKFQEKNRVAYIKANRELADLARPLDLSLSQLALVWACSQKSIGSMLVGVRSESQARQNFNLHFPTLDKHLLQEIDQIIDRCVPCPIGAEFMAPDL